ncbi:adenylyltransferase/cytidyltransferase family protein [Candidatus Woesearchaeota archaeon]|nr:adenylyltransferase/cytidyltransferase family protein [Candidatus Woesearchaeota archaeon]
MLGEKELLRRVGSLKREGKKIVTCNGVFDIIHPGHISFLEEAKAQGDILIVAVNTDSSVKENRGPSRPINKENDRARVLAALACTDYILLFGEKTPISFLEKIKPDVHVNGSEYGEACIEAPTVKKNNGKLHIVHRIPGYSTTGIIKKIGR